MRLVLASLSHGSRSGAALFRIIAWNLFGEATRFDQHGSAGLDRRDGHGVGLAQMIAGRRHQPRDRPCGWHLVQLPIGSSLGAAAARCPFAHHTQGASEAFGAQPPPEFRPVPAARTPQLIQEGQMRIKRALPNPEDISPLAADHLANQLPAVTGAAHDLLDGDAFAGELHDGGIRLLAPKVALVLQLLGAGEQSRIDRRGTDRRPDRPHRLAHGVKEGRAGILHEVPAIGHLDSLWQSLRRGLTITATAVSRDDPDLRVIGQPRLDCCALAIRQERHDPPSFQVADDRAIAMIPAPRPVIDANHVQRPSGRAARRRTTRSSVSLLTGTISRLAKPAAGRPPSARPR